MPCSGKSTVGKIIANRLNLDFIDGDEYIEKKSGMAVSEIIFEKGEEYFKNLEEKVLSEIEMNNAVFAPGGSIIYHKKLMENLKSNSIIIYLDVNLNTIKKRMNYDRKRRIIGLKYINLDELYLKRKPLYKKYASFEVGCDKKDSAKIADEIVWYIANGIL